MSILKLASRLESIANNYNLSDEDKEGIHKTIKDFMANPPPLHTPKFRRGQLVEWKGRTHKGVGIVLDPAVAYRDGLVKVYFKKGKVSRPAENTDIPFDFVNENDLREFSDEKPQPQKGDHYCGPWCPHVNDATASSSVIKVMKKIAQLLPDPTQQAQQAQPAQIWLGQKPRNMEFPQAGNPQPQQTQQAPMFPELHQPAPSAPPSGPNMTKDPLQSKMPDRGPSTVPASGNVMPTAKPTSKPPGTTGPKRNGVDGILGDKTRAALNKFKADKNIPNNTTDAELFKHILSAPEGPKYPSPDAVTKGLDNIGKFW